MARSRCWGIFPWRIGNPSEADTPKRVPSRARSDPGALWGGQVRAVRRTRRHILLCTAIPQNHRHPEKERVTRGHSFVMMSKVATAMYRERLPKLETVVVNTDPHYVLEDNPLADPGIVGAGAGLGAVAAIVLGGLLPPALQGLVGVYIVPLAAFLSGWASVLMLYTVATCGGRTSVATMLLEGIALGGAVRCDFRPAGLCGRRSAIARSVLLGAWVARRGDMGQGRDRHADHRRSPRWRGNARARAQRAGLRRGHRAASRDPGETGQALRHPRRRHRRGGRGLERDRFRRHRGAASSVAVDRVGSWAASDQSRAARGTPARLDSKLDGFAPAPDVSLPIGIEKPRLIFLD